MAWRQEFRPGWHCSYSGAVVNETAKQLFAISQPTDMPLGTCVLSQSVLESCEFDKENDLVEHNNIVNENFGDILSNSNAFFHEFMRCAKELCTAANTGATRRETALKGMGALLCEIQNQSVDVATRAEARHKYFFES